MSKYIAAFGRLMVVAIFIASGLDKFQSFDTQTGGPNAAYMSPKLDHFLDVVQKRTNLEIPLQKEHYPYLILIAAFLEVAGGILFLADSALGAVFLMLFLLGTTPIMHNFWDHHDHTQVGEMIHFMKNLSIFGGLVAYTAAKRENSQSCSNLV